MKFRPCIDMHNGKVKQIVGSTLSDNSHGLIENFVSEKSAQYFAEMYKKDKLTGGHIIMLNSGNEDEAVKALKAYPLGLQIGGGINPENAEFFINAGASHVIVTSYVFKDGKINFNNLNKLINVVGKEKLVLDLSCREKDGKYLVVTDRWQKFTDFEVNYENLSMLSRYCAEIFIHGVDVEGKCKGIQEELIKIIGNWASKENSETKITYAGGISSMHDIELIEKLGMGKIDFSVGSALDVFGGKLLKYKDLIRFR